MCNEVPRACQNWFTITRFRYIEVLFLIFYYYWDKQKELVTHRFVISRLHCIILPGVNFQLYLENERLWYPWIRTGRDVLLHISAYKAIQKRNQRVPMATHGLIIIKMNADVELAISLPVHFKSVKKWTYVIRKKKTTKVKKKGKKSFPQQESNPGPSMYKVNALPIAPGQLMLHSVVNL